MVLETGETKHQNGTGQFTGRAEHAIHSVTIHSVQHMLDRIRLNRIAILEPDQSRTMRPRRHCRSHPVSRINIVCVNYLACCLAILLPFWFRHAIATVLAIILIAYRNSVIGEILFAAFTAIVGIETIPANTISSTHLCSVVMPFVAIVAFSVSITLSTRFTIVIVTTSENVIYVVRFSASTT